MQEFGHPEAPVIEEFITPEGDIIPGWFEALVILARAHTRNRNHPALALAPRPKGGYNAEILRLVGAGLGVQEMQEVQEELQGLMQGENNQQDEYNLEEDQDEYGESIWQDE